MIKSISRFFQSIKIYCLSFLLKIAKWRIQDDVFIETLYQIVLRRQADLSGKESLVRQLKLHGYLHVVQVLMSSAEYQRLTETSQREDAEFVDVLYMGVMQRLADEAGKASLLEYLRANGHLQTVKNLISSSEYKSLVSNKLHQDAMLSDLVLKSHSKDEAFVQALYEGVSRIKINESAQQNLLRKLHTQGYQSVISIMMASKEASDHVIAQEIANRLELLQEKEIISLGTHCFTASYLKAVDVKKISYPFDWIFSSPEMIMHCLSDDFETFLSSTYYEPSAKNSSGSPVQHEYYLKNFSVSDMFNHHPVHLVEGYAYLRRSVESFRKAAQSSHEKVYLLIRKEESDKNSEDTFYKLATQLSKYAKNAKLVYITVFPVKEERLLPETYIHRMEKENLFYHFHPISKLGNTSFESAIDTLAFSRILERLI